MIYSKNKSILSRIILQYGDDMLLTMSRHRVDIRGQLLHSIDNNKLVISRRIYMLCFLTALIHISTSRKDE